MRDGKLLLVDDFVGFNARAKGGEWELPGGGLDYGEDMREGLKREIKEEMGLTPTWIGEKPLYMWTNKRIAKRGIEWFYVLGIAFAFEVENLNFTPSDECRSIQFFSKDELMDMKDKIGDQLHPLIDMFNPDDFKNLR